MFRQYATKTAGDRFRYARRFGHCLLGGDFGELLLFSDDKRVAVMKALSALSKFLGCYDDFRVLVKNYGLKWSTGNSDDLIIARLTRTVDDGEVIRWVRRVKAEVADYAVFMDFAASTGLRFCEAVDSYNPIIGLAGKTQLPEYYDGERNIPEHYRFKDTFIRRRKKVFVTYSGKPDTASHGRKSANPERDTEKAAENRHRPEVRGSPRVLGYCDD